MTVIDWLTASMECFGTTIAIVSRPGRMASEDLNDKRMM